MKTPTVLHPYHTFEYLNRELKFWNSQIGYWLNAVKQDKKRPSAIVNSREWLGLAVSMSARFRKLIAMRQAVDMVQDLKKWSDSKV